MIDRDLRAVSNRQGCLNSILSRMEGSIDCHRNIESVSNFDVTKFRRKPDEAVDHRSQQQQETLGINQNMKYLLNTAIDYRCEDIPISGELKDTTKPCHIQSEPIRGIERFSGRDTELQPLGEGSLEVRRMAPRLNASDQISDKSCPPSSKTSALDHSISVLNLSQNSCNSSCQCACHRRHSFRSPNFLNSILGSLFVAYEPSPWSTQACDIPSCQKRSQKLTYTYAFPRWFLHRVLIMNIMSVHKQGPEFVLRMMRIRHYGGNIFWNSPKTRRHEKKYIQQVERWMDRGLLSIMDVSTDGHTHLHVRDYLQETLSSIHMTKNDVKYALRSGNCLIAEMLIRRGADLYYEDNDGR